MWKRDHIEKRLNRKVIIWENNYTKKNIEEMTI